MAHQLKTIVNYEKVKTLVVLFLFFLIFSPVFAQTTIISDNTWKGVGAAPAGGNAWMLPGYNDSSWPNVAAPNPGNVIGVVAGSVSMWNTPPATNAYMRKTFTVPLGDSYTGSITIRADDGFDLYFNGVLLGSYYNYQASYTFSISPDLHGCVENVIAVIANNGGGGAHGASLVAVLDVVNPLYSVNAIPATIACGMPAFIANWDPVATADYYLLDVSTDSTFSTFLSGYQSLNVGNALSQNITGLTLGATYYYRLSAVRDTLTSCPGNVIKVVVSYNPTAGFTHGDVCLGDSVYFTNTSSVDASTSISTYLWVFGDGSPTSNMQHPAHYYTSAGTYNVTLVCSTVDGCSDAVTIPVNVYDPPVSAFTFNNVCLLDTAHFTNTSTNPTTGTIGSWSWDFGDASPVNTTSWNPAHLYALPGTYAVTLITYSSTLGCADTLQDSITVFPLPFADFGVTDVCLNQAINFTDQSTILIGTITDWSWNFGDGSPLNSTQNPGYTYTNPGSYTVTLIATSNNGCKTTVTKSVVVHPLPIVAFSAANVCDGTSVLFNNLSSIATTDAIQSQAWDFGDNSPFSTSLNPLHLYANPGSYNTQLIVVSNFGCVDSIVKSVVVNPNPVVNFTATDTAGCDPFCTNFQDLSVVSTGNNVAWVWNFGDGSAVNTTQNSSYCYINDSVFSTLTLSVSLTVTSDSGCVTSFSKNNYITVYPNPTANFSVQPGTVSIIDPVISITDLSIGANSWDWDFGDGNFSSLQPPLTHTYADTGTYVVGLITATTYGCIDIAYQTITIEPDFLFYIPNAFSPNADDKNDTFSGQGIFIKEYEMRIFDRWGNMIFFSDNINKPWDGKANKGSEIALQDVYVYSITVTDFKKGKHIYNGTVTLVR